MSVDSEEQLVGLAVGGDRDALGDLLLRHHDRALSLIRHWLSRTAGRHVVEPEDILQEALVRAVAAFPRFQWRGPGSFGRWLAEIARNQLLDRIRHELGASVGEWQQDTGAADDPLLRILARLPDDGRSPVRAAAAAESAELVRLAISGLRPDYRDAIAYRYVHGLEPAEIARIMDRSRHDIHNLCHRALNALRAALGRASLYLSRG